MTIYNDGAYLTFKSIFHKALNLLSSIVKSHPNPFLEPSSTKQQWEHFLLKETTGAFDGARINHLHITSQTCNPQRHAAPYVPM